MAEQRIWVEWETRGVILRAQVVERLEERARTLLKVMAEDHLVLDPESGSLDGVDALDRLRSGGAMWWWFAEARSRPVADGFEIIAPDFFADPPVRTTDLTHLLDTREKMLAVCIAAGGAEGVRTRASDRVVLTKGWEDHDELVMIRDRPTEGDSGWFVQPAGVVPTEEWQSEDLVAVAAWQLLRDRPELVWGMNLPTDFVVKVMPGRIVHVADEGNRLVAFDIVL